MFGKNNVSLLIGFLIFALIGACSNPADNVTPANVSDPKSAGGEKQVDQSSQDGQIYVFTPESTISFIGSKVTGSHDGGFKTFKGQFTVVDQTPETATGSIEIDTTSIWSDNDRLTNHLKSDDFFDVEKYPTSTFTLSKIEKGESNYTVHGQLNLHGVTKDISFPADIEVSEDSATLNAEFYIKRFDFGIEYKGRADDLIRDEVVIKLAMKAIPEQS